MQSALLCQYTRFTLLPLGEGIKVCAEVARARVGGIVILAFHPGLLVPALLRLLQKDVQGVVVCGILQLFVYLHPLLRVDGLDAPGYQAVELVLQIIGKVLAAGERSGARQVCKYPVVGVVEVFYPVDHSHRMLYGAGISNVTLTRRPNMRAGKTGSHALPAGLDWRGCRLGDRIGIPWFVTP
jgi:hypothetical protein